MVMLIQVLINSVDVTSNVISAEYEQAYGDIISQIEINVVRRIANLVSLETGQTITVYRGWTMPTEELIFNGYIESFESEGGKIKIIGKDKMWDLIRKEVTHFYDSTIDASAGKISEIFEDLVETYGGINADVEDSGTDIVLDKFRCNHTDIMERCKTLNQVLDWQFYYRANTDKVYFEPKGFTTNSTVLTIGTNVYQAPKWTYDNTEMVNDLTIAGAFQEIETTESGRIGTTSGYTTTGTTISFEPISVKVYSDASNPPTTLLVGGLPDSTVTYDYYVDKNQKKIIPAVGTTFADTNYMEIRYSHAVPIPVHLWNQDSIDSYGQFKKTITLSDLRSVTDAEQRASNYLAEYSEPFVYTTLKVRNDSTYNLRVGDYIRIVDKVSTPNVDEFMVISRLRIRYPTDYDEIVVGDKPWRLSKWQESVENRLKRLQEDELANQDLITEIVTLPNQILLSPRIFEIYTNDGVTGDELFIRIHCNNSYDETFTDTEFKDEGNTTANWDVVNHQLKFYT